METGRLRILHYISQRRVNIVVHEDVIHVDVFRRMRHPANQDAAADIAR